MPKDPKEMPFLAHLEELRWRIIKSLISILLFSIVTYVFSEKIIDFLTKTVDNVYFTSPTEAFAVRIKISLILGLMLSFPVIFYQLWQFVVPGLLDKEAKVVIPAVIFATFFFIGGALFCFFLVLPVGIKFLLSFQTDKLKPWLSIKDYVSFVAWMILAFGLVFQLPIVSFFLGKIGLITHKTLSKGRKYAIVIILILAAALTPSPDIFSQLMLAVPLYFLYEVSIIVVRVTNKKS
ncbi:MAG: twin arginine-targeting protein translocase TatC [candidate division Zixibacteria bacterium RBG_16_40_9]|nr:MAG: twin arginine-targeting protein translocase TatC [candidate division Zixibacteria bacterium RBG_16_40_9]